MSNEKKKETWMNIKILEEVHTPLKNLANNKKQKLQVYATDVLREHVEAKRKAGEIK